MKNNKLYTLGVLAATGLVLASAMPVKADTFTGGGKTDVTYTPGESGGQGGDGSLSDWVVKYPKKTELTDKSDKIDGAATLEFSLVSRDDTSKYYMGNSTVNVSLDSNADKTTDNKYIKLRDTSGPQNNVTMGITKFASSTNVDSPVGTGGTGTSNDNLVGTLTKGTSATDAGANAKKTSKAFLAQTSGAKANTNYKTQLSFTFSSTN